MIASITLDFPAPLSPTKIVTPSLNSNFVSECDKKSTSSIDIISVLPKLIESPFNASIIKRAVEKKIVEINFHDLKDYASNKRKQVDDYQFGGGSGIDRKSVV